MTTTTDRDKRHGVQKTCKCSEAEQTRCAHSWYLRWTWKKKRWQEKIDDYAGEHVISERRARELAEEIKQKIKAGTFRLSTAAPVAAAAPVPVAGGLTVEALGELYFASAVSRRTGKPLTEGERWRWDRLCNITITRRGATTPVRIGDIPAASVTGADIDAFRGLNLRPQAVTITDKNGRRFPAERGGISSTNRTIGRWQTIFAWAVRHDHIEATPFLKGGLPLVQKLTEIPRDRRLLEGERERLLSFGSQRLRDFIECALETACRKGELLNLRWYQVRWNTNEIALEARQTKTSRARLVPLLPRVRAILERRRLDPTGQPYGPMQYVFGPGGARPGDFKKAWTRVRLRAAGFTGQIWKTHTHGALTPEARQALKEQNLHFHDLRREAASTFVDDGMDVRAVQVFVGHANLSQLNTYLGLSQKALHGEVARMVARRDAKLVSAGIASAQPEGVASGAAVRSGEKSKAS